jgi:hypothetical protein
MFQEVEQAESSTFATLGPYPPPTSSLRIKITATIIREEAAESLLVDIQEEAELVALACVLNRYDAQWWVQHLLRQNMTWSTLILIRCKEVSEPARSSLFFAFEQSERVLHGPLYFPPGRGVVSICSNPRVVHKKLI